MRLYYMTTLETATTYILPEKRLRYGRFDKLNDPFELLAVDMTDPEHREIAEYIRERFVPRYGVLCMGKEWGSPLMWAHYAKNHTGICLGFDVLPEEKIRPVEYVPSRVPLLLDSTKEPRGITEQTFFQAVTTKYADWAYEKEFRFFGMLDDPDPINGYFYLPFDTVLTLREVIVGSRCDVSVESMAEYVSGICQPVTIIKAAPAFDSFKMIPDKNMPSITLWPQYAQLPRYQNAFRPPITRLK